MIEGNTYAVHSSVREKEFESQGFSTSRLGIKSHNVDQQPLKKPVSSENAGDDTLPLLSHSGSAIRIMNHKTQRRQFFNHLRYRSWLDAESPRKLRRLCLSSFLFQCEDVSNVVPHRRGYVVHTRRKVDPARLI